jgi:uncharacterized hydantoinase/oxoprolinase family protein
LLLGELPESVDDTHTADGRPATRGFAHDRLARQICADRTMFDAADALAAASAVKQAQLALLAEALRQLRASTASDFDGVVIAGQGEFLLRQLTVAELPRAEIFSVAARLGPQASGTAAAHAVAVLAAEQFS